MAIYGADAILEQHLGRYKMPIIPRISWQHGWQPKQHQFAPRVVAMSELNLVRLRLVLVAREDEADYLRREAPRGLKVAAVGLPIIYAETRENARKKGSLLVMPSHTIVGTQASVPDYRRYVDYATEVRQEFSHSAVSLHTGDFANGLHQFWENRGWKVVRGADPKDASSLRRMRSLFEEFETVTTNGWVSHVPYAACFGARISISGPRYSIEVLPGSTDYALASRFARQYLCAAESVWRELVDAEIVCPIQDAKTHVSWGRTQVGWENRANLSDALATVRRLRPLDAAYRGTLGRLRSR